MHQENCKVLDNREVAPGHWAMRLESRRIAQAAAPGQFVQILCADSSDPLLPRPFSFLAAAKKDFSILYQVVGKGTSLLTGARRGAPLKVLGPLGKGCTSSFRRKADKSIQSFALVGGGVGVPPILHLAGTLLKNGVSRDRVRVFQGARTKSLLLCERDFRKLGVGLTLATDDGSRGKKGFVTGPLEGFLAQCHPMRTRLFTCGPTPMLRAVSALAARFGVCCEVSVEVPMACGFGACLGCAIKVRGAEKDSHRFAIACCEGPVFQAKELLWD
jgi:dihydroorotate dehydrogenase electron transfer subunit